jgi:hypothetical protein
MRKHLAVQGSNVAAACSRRSNFISISILHLYLHLHNAAKEYPRILSAQSQRGKT